MNSAGGIIGMLVGIVVCAGFDEGSEAVVACPSAKDDVNTLGNQNSQR